MNPGQPSRRRPHQISTATMPTPDNVLAMVARYVYIPAAFAFVLSFIRLPHDHWLGNPPEPIFAFIGPALVVLSCGLVTTAWYVLRAAMWAYGKGLLLVGK